MISPGHQRSPPARPGMALTESCLRSDGDAVRQGQPIERQRAIHRNPTHTLWKRRSARSSFATPQATTLHGRLLCGAHRLSTSRDRRARSQTRSLKLSFSQDSLVLYGFFLVVGGLLLALRARRADESPQRNNSLMLAAVITMTGLGFWAASLLTDK